MSNAQPKTTHKRLADYKKQTGKTTYPPLTNKQAKRGLKKLESGAKKGTAR